MTGSLTSDLHSLLVRSDVRLYGLVLLSGGLHRLEVEAKVILEEEEEEEEEEERERRGYLKTN